jgi:hypothetical protein
MNLHLVIKETAFFGCKKGAKKHINPPCNTIMITERRGGGEEKKKRKEIVLFYFFFNLETIVKCRKIYIYMMRILDL